MLQLLSGQQEHSFNTSYMLCDSNVHLNPKRLRMS